MNTAKDKLNALARLDRMRVLDALRDLAEQADLSEKLARDAYRAAMTVLRLPTDIPK
jgi:hypothetical protein